MKPPYVIDNKLTFFILLSVSYLFILPLYAQKKPGGFFGDILQGTKDVKSLTNELKNTTKEIKNTAKEVKNTITEVKKTWTKDESENIKYKQVPDYRNREEVEIGKNQKLAVINGEFKSIRWDPVTKFDDQVFPSFIIGWASYKGTKDEDMGSSLGFVITNNLPKTVAFKWEIDCGDKTFFDVDSGFIAVGGGNKLQLMPKISWNYRALTKHETSAPVNITFRLVDPLTGRRVQKSATIILRSINDCIRFYGRKDYRYMYGVYVNEDHPEIDKILGEALKTKMVNDFGGYQGNSRDVDLQIAAIWRVLHDRGFKYSNITANSGDNSGNINAQTIRTFENAIKTSQANCVDGTALFASILKRIGISPVMVLIDRHCFLGYRTGQEADAPMSYLETTWLSNDGIINNSKKSLAESLNREIINEMLPKGKKLNDKNKCYYLEFFHAKLRGILTYDEHKKDGTILNELDVMELRRNISPIPYYQ